MQWKYCRDYWQGCLFESTHLHHKRWPPWPCEVIGMGWCGPTNIEKTNNNKICNSSGHITCKLTQTYAGGCISLLDSASTATSQFHRRSENIVEIGCMHVNQTSPLGPNSWVSCPHPPIGGDQKPTSKCTLFSPKLNDEEEEEDRDPDQLKSPLSERPSDVDPIGNS